MEVRDVKYNDKTISLCIYDAKSITDIKEGELFGIIASRDNMEIVRPFISICDGVLKKELDACVSLPDDFMDEEFTLPYNECFPLIFKKLKGNIAYELMSGETFALACDTDIDTYEKDAIYLENGISFEQYQLGIDNYADSNVIINCSGQDIHCSDKNDKLSGIYVVDDNFKYFYSVNTLSRKDDVVYDLITAKRHAREIFTKYFTNEKLIDEKLAYADDVIYDAEKSLRRIW